MGGETGLHNLVLLCSGHHALLHEGGFTIGKDYRDRWFFRRPDGRAVPACGYRPEDVTDDIETIDEYFGGGASAEVWRASAEASGAFVEAWTVREPSVEPYSVRVAGAWVVNERASAGSVLVRNCS